MPSRPMLTDHVHLNRLVAVICAKAVQMRPLPFKICLSFICEIDGGHALIDVIVMEDCEIPPISATFLLLHAVDYVAISLRLAQS